MKFLLSLLISALTALPFTPPPADIGSGGAPSVRLPVFMYHRLLNHPSSRDPYTITPAAFESDLKYLGDNGYTTVGSAELLAYAEDGAALPEKPVMLTFDDGYFNNIHYAAPLLEKYGMKAVIFVVGHYSDLSSKDGIEKPNYSYITWERMENLPPSIEIQNHTWNMHNQRERTGIRRKRGESRDTYQQTLARDIKTLNDKIELHTGKRPSAFAVPYGLEDAWMHDVLRAEGIKMCFCSEMGVSVIKRGDPAALHRIKRLLRSPAKSAEVLLKKYA